MRVRFECAQNSSHRAHGYRKKFLNPLYALTHISPANTRRNARRGVGHKLLKAETLAEATRPQFTTGAYGFGFQLGRPDEARTYGHGGGAPGMNAILRVYPESGQSVKSRFRNLRVASSVCWNAVLMDCGKSIDVIL